MARRVTFLSTTESVCPECLECIPAERIAEGDAVYLRKACPTHGGFKTVLWRGLDSYAPWGSVRRERARPNFCKSSRKKGCPFDCGLCPDHRQHTCCVVLDVTQRCNLACPVCFASAGNGAPAEPTHEQILRWCHNLLEQGGPFNIHLSGGEPTLRADLPELVRDIRALGFTYQQLNTNGIRLAADRDYAEQLKQAGLSCVFLQFDGVTNDVFVKMRGKPLLETKLRAIENCAAAELGVVLVPTLAPGINTDQIGVILRAAIKLVPAVRAVHFQPVSYFGRYPHAPSDTSRITIPEVIAFIDQQTSGQFQTSSFYPASGENPYCSFHGKFWLYADGRIVPTARPSAGSCCGPAQEPSLVQLGLGGPRPGEGARRAQQFVAHHWTYPPPPAQADAVTSGNVNIASLDAFLAEKKHSFCISGMAFQDAWNLDLDRLRDCFLHVLSSDQRLVPLCAYNLTGIRGQTLYRGRTALSQIGAVR